MAESGLPALVLRAARDIGGVGTALDAELLLSTLIGSIYSGVLPDRGAAIDSFIRALTEHLDASDDAHAALVRAILDAWAGQPSRSIPDGPAWIAALGHATITGTYAYGDRYGDQTSYVAVFVYDDETLGGGEHAIVVLADHNLGIAKDIFIASPAAQLLDRLRGEVVTGDDEMTWFAEIEPATLAAAATAYLSCTDNAPELPATESLAANRTIAMARLRQLPIGDTKPGTAPQENLVDAFLASPEADLAGLTERTGAERESLTYCLGLIVDFATARGDALRWSPAGVETFLSVWVHERAILDTDDVALLPDALRAWIAWAGRRLSLPAPALQETLHRVRASRDEFVRLHETGERRSPAAVAMTAMLADGIDLTDMSAVDVWLKTYNGSQ